MHVSERTSKIVRLAYGCTFGVYTVILGMLMLWQVLVIYHAGIASTDGVIFTREIVGNSISRLSPALWLWLVLTVVGLILWEIFLVKEKLPKLDVRYTLHILKKRVPKQYCENIKNSASIGISSDEKSNDYGIIRAEEKLIRLLWICCVVIGLAGGIYSIVYLATPSHFPKVDVTHEMLNMVKNVMPWVIVTLAFACGICVYEGISAKKQLTHVKKLIAAAKRSGKDSEEAEKGMPTPFDGLKRKFAGWNNKLQAKAQDNKFFALLNKLLEHRIFVARVTVTVIAVVFIIVGIVNGGARDVMLKAINICTECIGLG